MYRVHYEDLHQEHVQWLSQIRFWREEIKSLRNLCKKKCVNKNAPAKIYYAEIFNQLNHHERLLKSMENQIQSHENFMREMIGEFMEDGFEEGMTDHDHNRDHIRNFGRSFRELKALIYKQLEERPSEV